MMMMGRWARPTLTHIHIQIWVSENGDYLPITVIAPGKMVINQYTPLHLNFTMDDGSPQHTHQNDAARQRVRVSLFLSLPIFLFVAVGPSPHTSVGKDTNTQLIHKVLQSNIHQSPNEYVQPNVMT